MGTPLVTALRPQRAHIMELGLVLGFYLVYLLTRGLVYSDSASVGLANAGRIIAAEKSVGIFWEPGLQSWFLTHAQGLAVFFNWTYVFTYWPVIVLVGLALYFTKRSLYYYFRSVMAVNLVFALMIFMFFPVTSPFNVTQYFVNTIQVLGPSFYGSPEMGTLYNSHAAMPSLHFSWTVILGVLFLRSFRGWMRVAGFAYPAVTLMAITVTGNHFFLDAAVGGVLALVSFGLVELGLRGGQLRSRVRLEGLWRELGARRIPAPSRYEFPAWARLEGLWRELCARRSLAASRYEFPARARLEAMREEFRRLEARYYRSWSRTQERILSDVRRNWMYYRVAWLRFRARLPVVFRRPTTWGGGRYT